MKTFHKENAYALVICILTDWDIDKCLRYMKVSHINSVRQKGINKTKYKKYAEACGVIHSVTGISMRRIGVMLNINCETVAHAIEYYRKVVKDERIV